MEHLAVCIGMALLLLPGTLWAMTREHKFRLSHLMLGMFTYCAVLIPLKNFLIDGQQLPYVFMIVAICLIPMISGGVLVAVANEAAIPEEQRVKRWVYFIAGFLCPLSAPPALVMTFVMMALLSDLSNAPARGWLAVPLWLLTLVPMGVTLHRKYVLDRDSIS